MRAGRAHALLQGQSADACVGRTRLLPGYPGHGGMQAVAEAWRNITAVGAKPLAVTDNLNFGNPERPEVMELTWSLPEGTAGLAGPVQLRIVIEDKTCAATLVHGLGRVELERPTPMALERDDERGLWHAGAPGIFTATWRDTAQGREILYARTPIIEKLNVPGGTYEFRGMNA